MTTRAVLLVAALLLVLPGVAAAQDVADGIVVTVGELPLLLSEVQFEAEVRTVLRDGGRQVNLGPSRADRQVLEDLIERSLIIQEASSEVLTVDDEVNRRLEEFLDRFDRIEDLTRFLGRWKIGTTELRAWFTDEARARMYADLRLVAATRISEREILEAWRGNPERWGGETFEEAQDAVRDDLWQQRYDEQYRSWIEIAREKRGVRYTELGKSLFEIEG